MNSTESAPTRQSSTEAVVRATDLVREYSRSGGGFRSTAPTVHALDGVSLTVSRGEIVGIAGPSGSGKSTLLHLLAALDTPTDGTVMLGDKDVTTLSKRQRTRLRLDRVGIIFQRFHLLPALSARANVALPLVERGQSKRTRRNRAESLLEAVGLDDRVRHKPGTLSGGEQQRVAIARALATKPDLVVADEPTGELDSETGAQVLDLITGVADDRAVVLASHDKQALSVCDRVVSLQDGSITERGDGPSW